jgi:integrase
MAKLFLREEQIRQLIDLAKNSARDFALFHVMAATGLRASDIVRIKRTDVVEPDGSVVRSLRIRMKKTKKFIERVLRDDTRAAIAAYLKVSRISDYLFQSKATNRRSYVCSPMNRKSIHLIMKRYLRLLFPESELRGASSHVLRRSVAKLISVKCGRIEPAARFLGHRSLSSTLSYIDYEGYDSRADEAVQSLDLSNIGLSPS